MPPSSTGDEGGRKTLARESAAGGVPERRGGEGVEWDTGDGTHTAGRPHHQPAPPHPALLGWPQAHTNTGTDLWQGKASDRGG